MNKRFLWLAPVMGAFAISAAQAADPIKIGFVSTLTTGAAIIGKQQVNGANLALEHMGHKMGGRDVKILFEDDGFNPKQGKQKTDKLLKKDNVDIMTGYIWSHVLAASAPAVLKAGKIFISANAGYSAYAGKKCHKNFFNMSWENGEPTRAMGAYLNKQNIKKLYIMAPNYAAGKDVAKAMVETYKGEVVGRDMTPMKQSDWSAEFAKVRASGADAVFIFYPGQWGPKFLTQYEQAGMYKKFPLYNVFSVDNMTLPFYQYKAKLAGILGTYNAAQWSPDMTSPQNQRFVKDYKKKHGQYPSHFAAQAYEAIMLIKSGADAVRGNMKDTDGLRAAMEKVDFPTLRDKFRFGKNHYPIQNYYSRKIVADKDGKWWTVMSDLALKDHETPHVKDCKL